ncbi:MAG: ATP-binding cassette domain-containing protein [Candidatus Eremiobacteraeota bacterium]|nr:ATP-binding cassette domain-containing protein [Candidatus Eremiobacteraeota bacterium]
MRLQNVDVYYDTTPVLREVNWEIRRGAHWRVRGPNGAGKSTLAKLLYGRVRAAIGGTVERFGTSSGSVWELRDRVSLLSDDEQTRYDWNIPAEDVVASGFFHSVGLIAAPSAEQRATAAALMRDLKIEHLARRSFLELSSGERRMVLVARALVRVPELLILDEAFNGFDVNARARLCARVEKLAGQGTTVIVIGHNDADVPAWITHALDLEGGRVVRISD